MDNQLNILSESLDKKLQVLEEISEYNSKQEKAFKEEQADLDSFDAALEEKERLIQELSRLDDGFETLYERISEELKADRTKYADQIRMLQTKVTKVMELSVSIQAQETRNKKLIEDYFAKTRAGLKNNLQSSRAAYDYYKNMNGAAYPQSQYMDSKN